MSDNYEEGAERRPFGTSVEEVEADIAEGYLAYLADIAEGQWPGITLSNAVTFDAYRRDYWQEEFPALLDGTY